MLDPELLDGFTHRLYAVRVVHKFSVTSWGRTPWRNKTVGGKPGSKHVNWLAVDLVEDPQTDRQGLIQDLHMIGFGVVDEGDHLHVQAPTPPSGLLAPFKAPFLSPVSPRMGGTTGGEPHGIPAQVGGDLVPQPRRHPHGHVPGPLGPPIQSEKT